MTQASVVKERHLYTRAYTNNSLGLYSTSCTARECRYADRQQLRHITHQHIRQKVGAQVEELGVADDGLQVLQCDSTVTVMTHPACHQLHTYTHTFYTHIYIIHARNQIIEIFAIYS